MVKNFLLSVGVFIVLAGANAQDVKVSARVDSGHIVIGDWLPLHVEVLHPPDVTVSLPALPDSFDGLEVVRRDKPTVSKSPNEVTESVSFVITTFDSGMHIVPPLPVLFHASGDTTTGTVRTPPVVFKAFGVAVDTSKEIKDIKPPLSVSITFAELLPYIIAIVVAAGVIWLVIYIRKKRKTGEPLIPPPPSRPPDEVALEALRSLDAEHVWQRGLVKEYYSRLTDIVRIYIERRFLVMAMEMTSDEILENLPMVPAESRDSLRKILVRADLAKFAKYQPLPQEHESSLADSRAFVEETSRKVAEASEVAAETKA